MELAHIVPIAMLDALPDSGCYLAISTLVNRYESYAKFYRDRSEEGANVILDNPVHEDLPYDLNDTLMAAHRIRPRVIVVPDVIDDVDQTMLQALRCAPEIAHYFPQAHLMAVPHAYSMKDYMACAVAMSKIPNVNYFGVSLERRLKNDAQALMRRRTRVIALNATEETRLLRIHLLGVSEQCTELADPMFQRACASCDASKFAVWALNGTPANPPIPVMTSYPGRERFGGSEGYFRLSSYPVGSRETLRRNLLTWTNYAYEMETASGRIDASLKEETK